MLYSDSVSASKRGIYATWELSIHLGAAAIGVCGYHQPLGPAAGRGMSSMNESNEISKYNAEVMKCKAAGLVKQVMKMLV